MQVFDRYLNYLREFANEGWNPWDIGISRKGDDGFGFIADHALQRVIRLEAEVLLAQRLSHPRFVSVGSGEARR